MSSDSELEIDCTPPELRMEANLAMQNLLPTKSKEICLLLVTGVLWGCTNPFIRLGTRGLRDVRARTRFAQVKAELAFLLTNWRYVIPFLVNQAGSLSYLFAVQRAPLSIAVPMANSLAFALTALTGAAIGAEEALDKPSILGIVLIVGGTALCCWDNTD